MIASYSTPYMQKLEAGELPNEGVAFNQRCAEATNPVTKETNYWMEMSGTSMSSPFVAGVLALWLEAVPTLTMDRVKEIIRKTATHDEFTAKDPDKWGMGKINALAGLKEILGTGSVNTVEADDAADKEEHQRIDTRLKTICGKAASELNLVVYGGECIMDADGSLSIIDFNDWPSFSPCRAEAAANIAKAAMSAVKARKEPNRNK